MINLIVAGYKTNNNKIGIGYKNSLPFYLKDDLMYFKKITEKNVVVMGRKTYESIKCKLPNRLNVVLSSTLNKQNIPGEFMVVKNFDELNNLLLTLTDRKIFIIGGNSLYTRYFYEADYLLFTDIQNEYLADTYFPDIYDSKIHSYELNEYSSLKISNGIKYRHLIYKKNVKSNFNNYVDNQYHDLLRKVLHNGNSREDRTNIGTISTFAEQIKIDISKYAPLLTTKKVAWKNSIKEMLFFLNGYTDSNILAAQNVNIWKDNTSRTFLDNRNLNEYKVGEMGPAYGWQIRYSGAKYPDKSNGIDQLLYIENLLKTDPFSRRILWNLWNPIDLDKMCLTPCHYAFQLYVEKKSDGMYLSGIVNLRSNDLFLGCPFNIIGYYALICILAIRCDMKPNELILNIGDAHIYQNHITQVNQQLTRVYKTKPIMTIDQNIKYLDWKDININHFDVIGYFPYPSIKADMAI